MSMCRVFSCVVGRGCLPCPVCSLGKTLLAFALLRLVFQSQICLLLWVSLDFLLLYSSPLWGKGFSSPKKRIFFLVLVLEGLVGLHRTIQLQLLHHYWLGQRLGLLWYWMVCLGNRDHSAVFEIAPKYCISDSFSWLLRQSIPRQVDKKSRGPHGEKGWNSQGGRKGKHFCPSTFLRII